MSRVKVAAILLCAGKSARMGEDHKLLLKIEDQSVLRRTVHEILGAKFFEVIAVTGYQYENVERELQGLPVTIIHNRDYEKGMHSSIRRGVMNLNLEVDFFAICLADQPAMSSADYDELIKGAEQCFNKKIICPTYRGNRGNPVLISKDLIPDVLNHPDDDRGCFYLFQKYEGEIQKIEMKNESSLLDIDTPKLFLDVKFHLEKRGAQ